MSLPPGDPEAVLIDFIIEIPPFSADVLYDSQVP